jgi:DNA ligase-associated metallophosphoesterase
MMPFSPKPLMNSSPRPIGLSKAHVITLAGLNFVPDLSGALYLLEEKLLLVADLHLEQGASLARRGLHVPPYDTAATLLMLEQVLAASGAERLVLLGDSFHDRVAHDDVREDDALRLRAITSRVDTIWIAGNHDPVAHDVLGGRCVEELELGPITLRHIPQKLKGQECEIAGHLHPGATVVQRSHRIRTKCFVADEKRIILPAFGRYTGALNVFSEAFMGLLDHKQTHVWMLGKTALHHFPFKRLG